MRSAIAVSTSALGALLLLGAPVRADDAAEIRQRLERWTQAFNAGRKAEACELFSKTLLSSVQGQGEADYETRCALISKALDDPDRDFHYSADIKEIDVEGDLAFVRLDWTLTVSPGGARSLEPGLDIFRREADGAWRIVRYMSYEVD